MTKELVKSSALKLMVLRTELDAAEAKFSGALDEWFASERGIMQTIADKCGISAQYLSDVRNGRRKLGDPAIQKLSRLK